MQPTLHYLHPHQADYVVSGGATHIVGLLAATYTMTVDVPAARIVGTSAGSYCAGAIAMKVPAEKAQREVGRVLQKNKALDGGFFNLVKHFGWARGEVLREAAFRLVGDVTLGETYIPVGMFVADTYEPELGPILLSSWTTPDVLLVDAMVASGAIPLGIQPQKIRGLGRGNRLFGDGGTGRNFPLDALDDIPERPTIGIRVKPEKPDAVTNAVRPWGWRAFFRSLMVQLMWASNHSHNTAKSKSLIVDVPALGDGLDFDIDLEEQQERWRHGVAAGRRGALAAKSLF
jgi:predicted acylesterase/phospholipase RssA